MKKYTEPVKNERRLKQLYELVLSIYLERPALRGICIAIEVLVMQCSITRKEYHDLKWDFEKRKPVITYGAYWFKTRQERIDFLNQIIKSLE